MEKQIINPSKKAYLNLGCGSRYLDEWNNIDFVGVPGHVLPHNLLLGIPYEDNVFELVYHSHVLEHFSKIQGIELIKECFRVMKKGGIIRIAIPDLEKIVKEYLRNLELAIDGDKEAGKRYEWNLIEMIDQIGRNTIGGHMLAYLTSNELSNKKYIQERIGSTAQGIWDEKQNNSEIMPRKTLLDKAKSLVKGTSVFNFYKVGKFRLGGEVHQWMYDRYSIKVLLEECGFSQVAIKTASTSTIADWSKYCLDSDSDGNTYKPDSLFVEAVK